MQSNRKLKTNIFKQTETTDQANNTLTIKFEKIDQSVEKNNEINSDSQFDLDKLVKEQLMRIHLIINIRANGDLEIIARNVDETLKILNIEFNHKINDDDGLIVDQYVFYQLDRHSFEYNKEYKFKQSTTSIYSDACLLIIEIVKHGIDNPYKSQSKSSGANVDILNTNMDLATFKLSLEKLKQQNTKKQGDSNLMYIEELDKLIRDEFIKENKKHRCSIM